jgi:ABC-type transport system substrate-binding protein
MWKLLATAALIATCMISSTLPAQTLNMMKGIDAPHYDAQRTTWSPTPDIVNMFQDALVALDWDGRTLIPYLAKSWEVSPDGKTYTFSFGHGGTAYAMQSAMLGHFKSGQPFGELARASRDRHAF